MKIFPSMLLSAALWFVVGCASDQQTTEPRRPGSGIAEYKQLTTSAQEAVKTALDALSAVAAQSNRCSPEVLTNFTSEISRLQIESLQIRARSQAMQARGDAYFQDWQANMAQVKDGEVRALAEKHQAELQQSFGQIKLLSQEGRESFQPFITGLRQLRNALEKDPTSLLSQDSQNLLQTTRTNGARVTHSLGGIQRELDSMTAMITPGK